MSTCQVRPRVVCSVFPPQLMLFLKFRPVGLSGVELIPPYERSQQSAVALGIDTGFQKAEGAESTSREMLHHSAVTLM